MWRSKTTCGGQSRCSTGCSRPRKALVAHPEATVDRNDSPRDVPRLVSSEPRGGGGDLRDLTEARGRNGAQVLLLLRFRKLRGHVGFDETGGDHIRGDTARTKFSSERPSEAHESGF